jgi:RHS repeat-associated protein
MLGVFNAAAVLVGTTEAAALTSLGYSGELWDAATGQHYLRARFYNPANAQFNRLDPFSGNVNDPQSLHKYAYAHSDPLGNVGPTGKFSMGMAIGIGIGLTLTTIAAVSILALALKSQD